MRNLWNWVVNGQNLAVVQAEMSFIGLLVLIWYAYETRRIRKQTDKQGKSFLDQLEAPVRPVLLIIDMEGVIHIQNVGPGRAFRVKFLSYPDVGGTQPESFLTLGVGDLASVGSLERIVQSYQGQDASYAVEYESLSRRRYRTTATWTRAKKWLMNWDITEL